MRNTLSKNSLLPIFCCLALLTGCSEKTPKTGLEPGLEFSESRACYGYEEKCVGVAADGRKLHSLSANGEDVVIATSSDQGKSWKPETYDFPLPENNFFSYDWCSVTQGENTLWVTGLSQGRPFVISSSNQGQSWSGHVRKGKLEGGLSRASANQNLLALLSLVNGLSVQGLLSSDGGKTWSQWESNFALPSNWSDWVLEPPRNSTYSQHLAVDAQDRVHLYLEDMEIKKEDKKKEGALHLRFSANGEFEWSEFLPEAGEVYAGDFARNSSLPNELYRVTSKDYKDKESVKEKTRYQVFMSISRDSGDSWQKPFMLFDNPSPIHALEVRAMGPLIVCSWATRESRSDIDHLCYSKDGGKSWTSPQRVDLKRPSERRILTTTDGVYVVFPNRKTSHKSSKRLHLKYAPVEVTP